MRLYAVHYLEGKLFVASVGEPANAYRLLDPAGFPTRQAAARSLLRDLGAPQSIPLIEAFTSDLIPPGFESRFLPESRIRAWLACQSAGSRP